MPDITVKRFSEAADFARLAEPWFMTDEAAHCLQLGLLGGMAAGEWQEDRFMAVVEENGRPALIALRTPPHALILSQCSAPHAPAALADYVSGLPSSQWPSEVMGPASTANGFTAAWPASQGESTIPSDRERIYRLDSVTSVHGVPGAPSRASAADEELLVDWFTRFHLEALPEQPFNAEQTVARWLAGSAQRQLWFWQVDGRPVSLAGAGNPTLNGIRLGPVYTPEVNRGNGYASALVADLSQRLLNEGRSFCTLFTDLNNPTSNHIYTQIGYWPVVDILKYRLGK